MFRNIFWHFLNLTSKLYFLISFFFYFFSLWKYFLKQQYAILCAIAVPKNLDFQNCKVSKEHIFRGFLDRWSWIWPLGTSYGHIVAKRYNSGLKPGLHNCRLAEWDTMKTEEHRGIHPTDEGVYAFWRILETKNCWGFGNRTQEYSKKNDEIKQQWR